MVYLLDANVLIRAHEDYYGIKQVPQFWDWLLQVATDGKVKMPFEIFNEISISKGPLKDWICAPETKKALLLDEEVDRNHLNQVLDGGYGLNLTDTDLEKIGQDPFLVAYGLTSIKSRTIVTKEVSAPSKQRSNRKLPDVCDALGVICIKDFDLYKALNFHTK